MTPQEIHAALQARFGEAILSFDEKALDPWALVKPEAIAEVAAFVKAEPALGFDNLMCLSAVDWPKETPPRLDVVYHLYSYEHGHTFVLKVQLPRDNPRVPTDYAAIVEFETQEAFKAMHSSPAHDKAGEQVKPLFDGNPTPHFYEVAIG